MELNEVVTPHYAFPVVGVILCAVLVFAFGFKSPGHPPSFDFEVDERKTAGTKKKKAKTKNLQNGHATISPTEKASPAQSPSSKKKEPKPNPKSHQSSSVVDSEIVRPKAELTENKNKINQKLPNTKTLKSKAKQKPADAKKVEEDNGEWTQQLSRKEKKNRKKGDTPLDDGEGGDDGSNKENLANKTNPPTQSGGSNKETKKKNKKNKETVDKDVKAAAALIELKAESINENESAPKDQRNKKTKAKKETAQKSEVKPEKTSNVLQQSTEIQAEAKLDKQEKKSKPGKQKNEIVSEESVKSNPPAEGKNKKNAKKENVETPKPKIIEEDAKKPSEEPKIVDKRDKEKILSDLNEALKTENIAFDEMQEIASANWQSTKSQKKRKKPRYEQ